MSGVNLVILTGYTGQDAEKPRGNGPVQFSIATSFSYKDRDSGEWQEKTEWHRFGIFPRSDKHREFLLNIQKGSLLNVQGSLAYSRKEDADGKTTYFTNINVQKLDVLARRRSVAPASVSGGSLNEPDDTIPGFDDEIGF